MQQDPWAWLNESQRVAPLSNTIAPLQASQEQGSLQVAPPNQTEQQMKSMMLNKGLDATAKGLEAGYENYQTQALANTAAEGAASMAPLSANTLIGAAPVAEMSAAPAVTSGVTTALTEAGVSGLAAPAMSTAAPLAGAAATGAATAGGEAALAALGPVGWAIGAGFLAHKLGLF